MRDQRRAMLGLSHMIPLRDYAAALRESTGLEVPHFDPLDAGTAAEVLFLFEKPGPMTSEAGRKAGSGFISRDNDDLTAQATHQFMRRAEIPRKSTVIWNVIPAWNGTRKITPAEWHHGLSCVMDLVRLLPHLRAAVLVGRRAGRARPALEQAGLAVIESAHPSPIVRASRPERWNAIPAEWARVQPYLSP
ncbi:uracil-DNA glycosylase [Azospirillum palustre]|uniref:Uracil-DNA glycosylase n=1 Tax=Azospirillum palustre TaxID=2044885 RepID=A0A2B8BNA8_9PROT|nr:uracil-DNA glycosylase [Azospirillum palustre]